MFLEQTRILMPDEQRYFVIFYHSTLDPPTDSEFAACLFDFALLRLRMLLLLYDERFKVCSRLARTQHVD
ncbi:hypothetical protein EVAR_69998_1 [Eumeta japonica]|uniref:Uncharacterized protein n=1 Tax=Eumeta variegata TaxID=151549 RepID=A0A4C2A3G3_EUMVA|nr:hypothetical protein EVAR_69998_1 [Eumeta japonica]